MLGTRRKALHLAEVIHMATRQPLDLELNRFIETGFVQEEPYHPLLKITAEAGLLLAGGFLIAAQLRTRHRSNAEIRRQSSS
jgi:hypothetical protein